MCVSGTGEGEGRGEEGINMTKRKIEGRRNKYDLKFSILGVSKDSIPLHVKVNTEARNTLTGSKMINLAWVTLKLG